MHMPCGIAVFCFVKPFGIVFAVETVRCSASLARFAMERNNIATVSQL